MPESVPRATAIKRLLKRAGLGLLALLVVAVLVIGIYVWTKVSAYDASMAKVYAVPPYDAASSSDPAAVARGKHLVEALAACASADCHGPDLGGGKVIDVGPIGTFAAPNLTIVAAAYTDGELVRL